MWIGTHVPSSSEFYERWWDGLSVDEYRVDGPSLIISGEIWHIRQR